MATVRALTGARGTGAIPRIGAAAITSHLE